MKIFIICSFLLLVACSGSPSEVKPNGESYDFYLLLSGLLDVNQDQYLYADPQGGKAIDSLKMFKELERIYMASIEPDLAGNTFSPEHLKLVMFFAFYAQERNAAAFQEYLAEDLMPIYIRNKANYLQNLKELPFLTLANCDRLNAYFGHEGRNIDEKSSFIEANERLFKKSLSDEQYKLCMRVF